MEYAKSFLTYEQQADLLIGRGMSADRDDLVRHLRDVGYYRLSGYWYIHKMQDGSDRFWEGTTFRRVWDMYVFDRQFRLVVLDSWLVTINTVRNICAHHGRLWNRVIGNPPRIPKAEPWHVPFEVGNERMFGTLTVLSYLLEWVAPETGWRSRLLGMVEGLPRHNQERMGFVEGWRECPIWAPYLPAGCEVATPSNGGTEIDAGE